MVLTYCECSADNSPVGRCFGSVLIAYPNKKSCITGRAIIKRRVIGSRRTWIHSLFSTARNRLQENRFILASGSYYRHPLARGGPELALRPLGSGFPLSRE